MSAANDLLEELDLLGAALFPLRNGGKIKGKYSAPKRWAQTDAGDYSLDDLAAAAAVGMVGGVRYDVLDVDPRNGGAATLADLAAKNLIPQVHYVIESPSGGWHLYVDKLGVTQDSRLAGLDLQDPGRMVLVPPTPGYRVLPRDEWPNLGTQPADAAARLRSVLLATREQTPATTADPSAPTTPQERSKAEAVLAKAVRDVEASEAGRNNTVARVLGALYNFAKAGVLDRDEVDAAIWEAAQAAPSDHAYDRDEFDATCDSIWRRAKPEKPAVDTAADDFDMTDLPAVPGRLDDAYLAEWMAKQGLGGRWCWGGGLGWLAWDDRRWVSRRDEDAREAVRQAVISMARAALDAGPTAERMRQINGLLSKSRIEALTSLMKGVVSVHADKFDQSRDLLNVGNGVVDLRTGELLPHDPALYLTKITETPYVPGAAHPDWTQTLTAFDPEVADWFQVRMGQAATGWPTSDDVLPIGQGGGSNGKSTLLAGLYGALGGHMTLIPEKLLKAGANSHPTELMTLFGTRVAVIDETPEVATLDVQRIKSVLGQERMAARAVFRDNVEWAPTHSLFVMSNYRPQVRETDHGTWRRLALVRFTKTFPKDDTFRARVARGDGGRREAVLAWVVAGAVRWYANDCTIPEAPARVRADTRDWRGESDLIVGYLNDRIVFDRDACVLSRELLEDFNDWQLVGNHKPWGDRLFSARFGDHEEVTRAGVAKGKPRKPRGLVRRDPDDIDPTGDRPNVWQGLRWRSSDDDL